MNNAFKILVMKSNAKSLHGRNRCWWEDNIKINLKEVWCEICDQIKLDQDKIHCLGMSEYPNESAGSLKAIKFPNRLCMNISPKSLYHRDHFWCNKMPKIITYE
jgi:hypothetical protein